MNTFNFYKQVLAVVLLSVLLTACSNKSKNNTNGNGEDNTTVQQDGNGTDDSTTSQIVNAGEDQNVTVSTPFELTATVDGVTGEIDYIWSEDGEPLPNGDMQTYSSSYDTNGEHNITATVTYSGSKTASDSVWIRVGKYADKEIIRDCNGILLIVKIHVEDDKGNLLTITEYRDLNGNVNPENDSTIVPYATATYDASGVKTTTFENGKEESYRDNRDNTGTGTIISIDGLGTTRTFNYKNNKLISATAKYKDGMIKEYIYNYEDGKLVSETVKTTAQNGDMTTETITFDDSDNTTTVNTDNICESTREFVQTFLWKY